MKKIINQFGVYPFTNHLLCQKAILPRAPTCILKSELKSESKTISSANPSQTPRIRIHTPAIRSASFFHDPLMFISDSKLLDDKDNHVLFSKNIFYQVKYPKNRRQSM